MMKFAIVFAALFAIALSAPLDSAKDAVILRADLDNVRPDGYNFAVETSDGKKHSEEGQLINVGTENEAIAVRGEYSWVDAEGQTYTVTYVADENGFQPQGAHLPTV